MPLESERNARNLKKIFGVRRNECVVSRALRLPRCAAMDHIVHSGAIDKFHVIKARISGDDQ